MKLAQPQYCDNKYSVNTYDYLGILRLPFRIIQHQAYQSRALYSVTTRCRLRIIQLGIHFLSLVSPLTSALSVSLTHTPRPEGSPIASTSYLPLLATVTLPPNLARSALRSRHPQLA